MRSLDNLAQNLGALRGITAVQQHSGALLREMGGSQPAKAIGTAGDEDDLILESAHGKPGSKIFGPQNLTRPQRRFNQIQSINAFCVGLPIARSRLWSSSGSALPLS